MDTKKIFGGIPSSWMDKHLEVVLSSIVTTATVLVAMVFMSCGKDTEGQDLNPETSETGVVWGNLLDQDGNPYPNLLIKPSNGSNGSGNEVVVDDTGQIETTLEHSCCILTDQKALVIPILYHINGKIFGRGHVPGAEETPRCWYIFKSEVI